MRQKKSVIWSLLGVLALAVLFPGISRAEEITLKDKTVLKGHTGAEAYSAIYFVPDDENLKPRWIPRTDIDSIRKDPVPVTLIRDRRAEKEKKS